MTVSSGLRARTRISSAYACRCRGGIDQRHDVERAVRRHRSHTRENEYNRGDLFRSGLGHAASGPGMQNWKILIRTSGGRR
jgi:hypothetical protein